MLGNSDYLVWEWHSIVMDYVWVGKQWCTVWYGRDHRSSRSVLACTCRDCRSVSRGVNTCNVVLILLNGVCTRYHILALSLSYSRVGCVMGDFCIGRVSLAVTTWNNATSAFSTFPHVLPFYMRWIKLVVYVVCGMPIKKSSCYALWENKLHPVNYCNNSIH